jgi:hypothetical protein
MVESDFNRIKHKLIRIVSRFTDDRATEVFVINDEPYGLKELLELERKNNLTIVGFGELKEQHRKKSS